MDSLCHAIAAIPAAKASWRPGSGLAQMLERLDGDVVQAMQALKETSPAPTQELEAALDAVYAALSDCKQYCDDAVVLAYPFHRGIRQTQDTISFLLPDKKSLLPSSTEPRTIHVSLPTSSSTVETFMVGTRQLPRLFNGLWQMASPDWGSSSAAMQETALAALVGSGLTAFDMSDHYGDAELVCGDFRARLPEEARQAVYMASKWCVFRDIQRPVTTEWVLEQVRERCRRLSGRVDMLQFHWYDVSFSLPQHIRTIGDNTPS